MTEKTNPEPWAGGLTDIVGLRGSGIIPERE